MTSVTVTTTTHILLLQSGVCTNKEGVLTMANSSIRTYYIAE